MEFPDNTPELIEYYERGVAHSRIPLNDMFEKTPKDGVGFEIAFSAFLATVLLTVPSTNPLSDGLAATMAVLLLLITLLRRVVVSAPHVDANTLMPRSMSLLIYLTILSTVHIGLTVSTPITEVVPLNGSGESLDSVGFDRQN